MADELIDLVRKDAKLLGCESEVKKIKDIVNAVEVDAICTDLPDFWYT